MSAASAQNSVTNANQQLFLLDYLMFYPFIDMAADTLQELTQVATLPRYTDGIGVEMMVVAQASTVGGGRFTITYTDTDDVSWTTGSLFCGAAQPPGSIVQAVASTAGLVPFVPQNANGKGIKAVTGMQFSIPNGGLAALVLVKVLDQQWLREESRRETTNPNSYGDVCEKEAISNRGGLVEIEDGAFLGILGRGANGSLASSVLSGTVETIWS